MLKTLIIIVVVLLLISLGASLVFLLVDQGKKDSKRTAYALGGKGNFRCYSNPAYCLWIIYW